MDVVGKPNIGERLNDLIAGAIREGLSCAELTGAIEWRWPEEKSVSCGFKLFPDDEMYREPTIEEMRQRVAMHDREQRLKHGPIVMSEHDIAQMKKDVAAVEHRQMMHRAMELNKIWTA